MKFNTPGMRRFVVLIVFCSTIVYGFNKPRGHQYFRVGKTSLASSTESSSLVKLIEEKSFDTITGVARFLSPSSVNDAEKDIKENIADMESGMVYLEEVAGKRARLKNLDLSTLGTAVLAAVMSPLFFGSHSVALIVPAMTGVSFSIGSAYEYFGKVAVSDGKETCATCFQTVAESEIIYCQAERVKSILPLCVGIATTAAVLSLLVERIAKIPELAVYENILTALFSLIAVLAAAIAGLANEETRSLVAQSFDVGRLRFTTGISVGTKWESETDKVMGRADKFNNKWVQFGIGVLPAPLIASVFPGDFGSQGIVCSAIAAAQAALYLVFTEYSLTRGLDTLGLKWRAASVAEQYAKQGTRVGSTLPFLTALGGLCLGLSAATAEFFPFIPSIAGRMALAAVFPTGAAIFAASSITRKEQCEIDGKAALSIAETGMTGLDPNFIPKEPIMQLPDLFNQVVNNVKDGVEPYLQKISKN